MEKSRNSVPLNKALSETVSACERALEEILARVVISAGSRLAVAYSGGLDSSVLLRLTQQYCAAHQITLYAFHIHHGLSPNADAWRAHCEAEATRLGVYFDARRVTIHDTELHGIEQAARLARYEALRALCQQHQITLLLTAHHQDDQAETVLLQLLRGAGLPGLSAMAPLHLQHDLLGGQVALGRPLLTLSRAQLEALASAWGVAYINDESNTDTRYRRNAVRQLIAPVLAQHFPGYAAQIARSSQHSQAAQRLLDELAMEDWLACAEDEAIRLEQLRQLSTDRIDNLLRYWMQQMHIHAPSTAQLVQLREQMLFASEDAHPLLQLNGIDFERKGGLLVMRPSADAALPPQGEISLCWQGEAALTIPEWRGSLVFEEADDFGLDRNMLLQGRLQLRSRSGGEKLKLDAARPSRTLKNLFQETGIAMRERAWLPLLYVDEALVFAAGLGADVRAQRAGQGGLRLRWVSAAPV